MHLSVELFREIWQSNRKPLILIAALLIVNLTTYVLLQQFFIPRVVDREERFISRQAEARQLLRQAGGNAETPEQLFAQARRDIAEFQNIVPELSEFTGLVDELLMLAYRSQLNIDQISYTHKAAEKVDLLQYDLSFAVNGQYAQLKKFIHALEQSPRIMSIRQIALSSSDELGQAVVSLRLKLETVFQVEARES